MWRVNITCDDQAWKLSGVEFKKIAENYKGELIGSKKMPDGKRIMSYNLIKLKILAKRKLFKNNVQSLSALLRILKLYENNNHRIRKHWK
jgi:hypothetical protein